MILSSLLAVTFIMKLAAVLFILCCVILVLTILIQKGKGGGLSGALAGGMAGNLLGTKTGDFLTWVTIAMVGVFLTLAVIMAKFYKPAVSDFGGTPPVQQSAPLQQPKSELPPAPAVPENTDMNLPGN